MSRPPKTVDWRYCGGGGMFVKYTTFPIEFFWKETVQIIHQIYHKSNGDFTQLSISIEIASWPESAVTRVIKQRINWCYQWNIFEIFLYTCIDILTVLSLLQFFKREFIGNIRAQVYKRNNDVINECYNYNYMYNILWQINAPTKLLCYNIKIVVIHIW